MNAEEVNDIYRREKQRLSPDPKSVIGPPVVAPLPISSPATPATPATPAKRRPKSTPSSPDTNLRPEDYLFHDDKQSSVMGELIDHMESIVFGVENMRLRSVLTNKQLVALVRLQVYADTYGSANAQMLVHALQEYAVSTAQKGGTGRKNLVDIMQALRTTVGAEMMDEKRQGLRQRLLGG